MIVGADDATDRAIMREEHDPVQLVSIAARLLLRVQPDPGLVSALLPLKAAAADARASAVSERLAAALLRLSCADELFARPDGMLDLQIDPKLAWALQHRELFPVDVNRPPREMLLRVPGLGVTRGEPHRRSAPHAHDSSSRICGGCACRCERVLPFVRHCRATSRASSTSAGLRAAACALAAGANVAARCRCIASQLAIPRDFAGWRTAARATHLRGCAAGPMRMAGRMATAARLFARPRLPAAGTAKHVDVQRAARFRRTGERRLRCHEDPRAASRCSIDCSGVCAASRDSF